MTMKPQPRPQTPSGKGPLLNQTILIFLAGTALLALPTVEAIAQAPGQPAQTAPSQAAPAMPAFARPPQHVNAPLGDIQRFPGDGAGAFKTHEYRDLFAEQGHPAAETKAKIEKAFQQFFHGDGQDERVYFETGANENGPLAYITDWANNDARTEGMSYGMMIAIQLNHKREFNALWNWSKTYMLITDPANPSVGYFAWSMATDGSPRSTGAAPDGEEYYAMALYFASHRWGNGKGIYNYQAEADKILRGMRHHPVLTGTGPFRIHPGDAPFTPPDHPWPSPNNTKRAQEAAAKGQTVPVFRMPRRSFPETIGPMVDEDHFMIKFVPNWPGGITDPSYHLPAFYELWARWGPVEDREFWAKAADVSRDFLSRVTGPETGLTPDQANFDGTQTAGWGGGSMPFAYDSWRSASNWSVDYSWWKKDARETGSRSSSIRRASTSSPIAIRSTASRWEGPTERVFCPQPLLPARQRARAKSRRHLLMRCGTRSCPPASSATTTVCFT
jgi:oligosaccharide reducing-end xylanase